MEYISAMILSPLLDIFHPLELSNDTVTLPALSGRAGPPRRRRRGFKTIWLRKIFCASEACIEILTAYKSTVMDYPSEK